MIVMVFVYHSELVFCQLDFPVCSIIQYCGAIFVTRDANEMLKQIVQTPATNKYLTGSIGYFGESCSTVSLVFKMYNIIGL